MKKQTLLAILIAAALLLSGCSLNTVDTVADNAQTILSVGSRTLDKATTASAVAYTQNMYNQYNQWYQYGYTSQYYDTSESSILSELLDSYTRNFVLLNKAEELGLDKELTEEELTEINTTAQENYDSMIESVGSNYITSGAVGDALHDEAVAYAESHDMTTLDEYVKEARESKLLEKIEEYVKGGVTVTDEDLQAKLDELVASAKAEYEADLSAYGTSVNNGSTVYYAPAGYRYIKHILIQFGDEDTAAVSEKQTAKAAAQTDLDSASTALADAEKALADAAADADKTALQTAVDEAKAAADAASEALTAASAAYDEALAAAATNIQARADEVYALVTAEGADFDALMAEYGEDPGMQSEPAMTNGYAVCASTAFVPEFLEAAMALENVGDISGEVVSSYGIHIIKYVSDIAEGAVSLDSVRDSLTETVKTAKETAAFDEALAGWMETAEVKSYPERMGY